MQVGDIMEKSGRTVATTDDLHATLEIMHAEALKVLPVLEPDGEVVGLIWRSALLEAVPDDGLDEALEETFPASDPISPGPMSD